MSTSDRYSYAPNQAEREQDASLPRGGVTSETPAQFIERKSEQWERERERPIKMKDIGREGKTYWVREAWTLRPQANHSHKVFSIERIRLVTKDGKFAYGDAGASIGSVEYRIGYWMLGRNGRATGRWTWGQYCPMIPSTDFAPLLEQALREGTLLEEPKS